MGYVSGVCTYHGENAHCENIPDLKLVRGVLYFGQGKVHCFKTKSLKRDAVVVSKAKVVLPDSALEPKWETEKQAKDLWESALENDLAPGVVEGRIFGIVYKWDEIRSFGFVRAADGTEYHVSRFDIFADEFNRKFLVVGEQVSFRTKDRRTTESNELSAVAVIPARVDFERTPPESHRDEMRVTKFDPIRGVGRLQQTENPNGSWIFFHRGQVITLGEIRVGARVWCGLKRRISKSKDFEAFAIELFMDEKGETE